LIEKSDGWLQSTVSLMCVDFWQVTSEGASPPGGVASSAGQRPAESRWKLATAASWFALGLACVALAALEHERSKAAATGASVLCGSLLSCSNGLERTSLLAAGRVKTQSLEEEEGDGSAKPETMEQAIDGFDLFSFGGEAPDATEPVTYFSRFERPGDEPGDMPEPPTPNAMEEQFVGDDDYKPFSEHSQFLQPGDVPYDVPARHHASGFFNFFGALRDKDENLLTHETVEQACCVCIPGAPDYQEKRSGGTMNPLESIPGLFASGLNAAETDIEGAAGGRPLMARWPVSLISLLPAASVSAHLPVSCVGGWGRVQTGVGRGLASSVCCSNGAMTLCLCVCVWFVFHWCVGLAIALLCAARAHAQKTRRRIPCCCRHV